MRVLKIFGVSYYYLSPETPFHVAVRETIESDPALSYAPLPTPKARGVLMQAFLELDRRV